MKKYVVELVGTLFLMLIITLAGVLGKAGDFAGAAIGIGLMAVIYGGGHVSRAHYNPAISVAFLMRDGMEKRDFFPYLAVQFVAAIFGALVGVHLIGGSPEITAKILAPSPALFAEIFFTLALAWVILQVATAPGLTNNEIYGLAIGGIAMAGIYTVGDISLAVFNPAVAVGLAVTGKLAWSQIWIPIVGSLLGAVAAAFLFQFSCCKDECE